MLLTIGIIGALSLSCLVTACMLGRHLAKQADDQTCADDCAEKTTIDFCVLESITYASVRLAPTKDRRRVLV